MKVKVIQAWRFNKNRVPPHAQLYMITNETIDHAYSILPQEAHQAWGEHLSRWLRQFAMIPVWIAIGLWGLYMVGTWLVK